MTLQNRFALVIGLIALIALSGAPAAAQREAGGNWPHFGSDGAHTACNPAESVISPENVAQLERQWGIGCDDDYFSVISRSPAIRDGVVYTSGAGRNLWANDARTGDLLWSFGENNIAWAPQPVVSEGGIVFYLVGPTGIYDLYAVDAATGAELWQSPIGFDLGFSDTNLVTVDEARGRVIVLESPFMGDGKLFALDMATGDIVWRKLSAVDNMEFKGDYALIDGDTVYAPATVPGTAPGESPRDHLISMDANSGRTELIYDAPGIGHTALITTHALCGDLLLAGYSNEYHEPANFLVAYHPDAPGIVWQAEFNGITWAVACNPDTGRIYVPTDPFLYALDAATGSPLWKYAGYGPIYNPSVANGVIYFISATNMYAIDEETGEELFFYRLGHEGYETSQVAISNGMLYFSGNGGDCDLFALGLPVAGGVPGGTSGGNQ
jgi:outer membrane protein assembly factor BamB